MVNHRRQIEVRVNFSLTAKDRAANLPHRQHSTCYRSPVSSIRRFLKVCVFSLGQSRNWTYNEQRRLMSQRQSQEERRQQEARRLDRERQMQASLRDEESHERRRYLRQVQEEVKERQVESALLKVWFPVVQVMFAMNLPLSIKVKTLKKLNLKQTLRLWMSTEQ